MVVRVVVQEQKKFDGTMKFHAPITSKNEQKKNEIFSSVLIVKKTTDRGYESNQKEKNKTEKRGFEVNFPIHLFSFLTQN